MGIIGAVRTRVVSVIDRILADVIVVVRYRLIREARLLASVVHKEPTLGTFGTLVSASSKTLQAISNTL